ncbi:ABC transporter permease [Haloferax mediterranei ATCC 33500]|uniref:ABC transporter permease n=1 Tax=Haloferax mediterranei (strain ATCC 33500 / DSM 1411 / JCM 8866 / NBRC 14739 / NCIMB 2177 / R-4) TaxID=523841 RepID=I3R4M3_HALMT|nr:ABC transporter permease [Haloferax mediterranei]AFK19183.1 ribose ABC transporter permease [Haloferax mediterranei ATCC 33500]AHZ21455.1 ribose ABC transporter permease [Haloferax mediterranei ATCC 33500]EMA03914.1 ribose ABC transporter permease [Haloferax mediterranei ATCC 33500]MDX5989282.1 ABC transporter permease [Haloferax mediterranei ATCC 33500]QCQ75653.1 ABC transporter permease [Haloferax mediterranei ATCC 33500]
MSARGGVKTVLRRLTDASVAERILISFAALVMATLIGAAIVLVSGRVATCQTAATTLFGVGFCYDPVDVYLVLFNGALGQPFLLDSPGLFNPNWNPLNFGLAFTLKETTLLIFTGLSVAVAFRAGLFNIGTQGQLVLGGLATALFAVFIAPFLPAGIIGGIILIPLAVLVGALVGGLYGAIPGALKAYSDANEVITTIMLNFIAAGIAKVLVSEFFRNPDSQVIETAPIPDWGTLLPVAFPKGSDFSILALVFGLALVVAVWYLLERTSFGYDLRTSGEQPEAAEYGGVDAKRTTVTSMFLSGALGGIGGAIWVLMVIGNWLTDVPSLGFDGITVSILAGNNPFGVIPAALLFGTLKSGSLAVQFQTGVPKQLVGVLRGLIILFVAMPEFFRMIGTSITPKRDREAVATDGGEHLSGGDDE